MGFVFSPFCCVLYQYSAQISGLEERTRKAHQEDNDIVASSSPTPQVGNVGMRLEEIFRSVLIELLDTRNGKTWLRTEQSLLTADDEFVHAICHLVKDCAYARMEPDVMP